MSRSESADRPEHKSRTVPKVNVTDRTSIYDWNNPTRDLSGYRWYNPVLWVLLIVDIAVLIRWYWWHKRQSWTAKRSTVHTDVVFGLQSCSFLLMDDDMPDHQKETVREIQQHFENVADELQLESRHLEKYSGSDTDRSGGETDE